MDSDPGLRLFITGDTWWAGPIGPDYAALRGHLSPEPSRQDGLARAARTLVQKFNLPANERLAPVVRLLPRLWAGGGWLASPSGGGSPQGWCAGATRPGKRGFNHLLEALAGVRVQHLYPDRLALDSPYDRWFGRLCEMTPDNTPLSREGIARALVDAGEGMPAAVRRVNVANGMQRRLGGFVSVADWMRAEGVSLAVADAAPLMEAAVASAAGGTPPGGLPAGAMAQAGIWADGARDLGPRIEALMLALLDGQAKITPEGMGRMPGWFVGLMERATVEMAMPDAPQFPDSRSRGPGQRPPAIGGPRPQAVAGQR